MCIKHNNGLWTITEFLHVKPGKGAAFVRTKLKSLTHGRVVDNTFPAGHKIDVTKRTDGTEIDGTKTVPAARSRNES